MVEISFAAFLQYEDQRLNFNLTGPQQLHHHTVTIQLLIYAHCSLDQNLSFRFTVAEI